MSKRSKASATKNSPHYVIEEELAFGNEPYDDFDRDRVFAKVMEGMLASVHTEAETALGLTKLYIDNISPLTVTKELLFATYKEAVQVVAEASPIKKMLGDMRSEEC